MGGGVVLAATGPAGAAEASVDCTLVVPADPLSAQGLATPYRLLAPCHESDVGDSAFVQATVIDPASGALSVYNPVVVDERSFPAARPVVPRLPAGAVVGIWFGFNGDNLALRDSNGSLTSGQCVNGLRGSIFGQFAYCDAPAFFKAANAAIAAGTVKVPDLGTAKDGQPCPSTRDFGLVDMDQSDNVTASYLFMPDGRIAQNTAANQAALAARGATVGVNASDNGLLDNFVMPALGCTPFTAPDLADNGRPATSLALNELQAAAHQAAPVALVPTSDPMTLAFGRASVTKTNLYRAGVDMSPVDSATQTPRAYCRALDDIGVARTDADRTLTATVRSPDPAAASNLFTFLAQRLSGSFTELGCARLLNARNPVVLTLNRNGVVVAARLISPSGRASQAPSASPSVAASASAAPSASTKPSSSAVAPSGSAAAAPPSASPTGRASQSVAQAAFVTTADALGADNAAGGHPAAVRAVPVRLVDTPAPTLPVERMPAKVPHPAGAGTAAGGVSPARIAGMVLLSGGGLVLLIVLIRALAGGRRRRYEVSRY